MYTPVLDKESAITEQRSSVNSFVTATSNNGTWKLTRLCIWNKDFWNPNGKANKMIPNVWWLEYSFTDYRGKKFERKIIVLNLRILLMAFKKAIVCRSTIILKLGHIYRLNTVPCSRTQVWRCTWAVPYVDYSSIILLATLKKHTGNHQGRLRNFGDRFPNIWN